MASTNKTEHLELNSWAETDRPQRNDFNSDNLIIDTILGEHVESESLHLTETEKSRVSKPFVIVPYAGTGEESLVLTLSIIPKWVWVYCEDKPFTLYDSAEGVNKVYSSVAFSSGGATAGVVLSATGTLTVTQSSAAEDGVKLCLNEENAQYKVVAFR